MSDTALVWFRNDLRLHDNEALIAGAQAEELLPVYTFDPHWFGTAEFGGRASFRYRKTGPHRARFLRESVADLRESLRARGSDLLIRHDPAAEVIPELVETHDVDEICYHTYPATEERGIEADVTDGLETVATRQFWGHTLYHLNDLPVAPSAIQDTFTPFRKNLENNAEVRDTRPIPELPPVPDGATSGELPELTELEVEPVDPDERGVLPFEGGEGAALDRLETYVWVEDRLREYKETRNGLLGADYSSKFSAWLNAGCLSPRRVHETVEEYEEERVSNESTYWLVFELIWRDFFQFQFLKHGGQFFAPEGIRRNHIEWERDREAFERWAAGETGIPFVDANMRELNRTGYMSNRGRQNVASFLANNLRIDWRWGAAYFETQLVDYDPASNYGNWAYNSQVGNDSRDKYFNIVKQARRYDSQAEYVKHWLPELEALPPEYAHEPWKMSDDEQADYGVELGIDYPAPMIDLEASYRKLR